MKQIDSKKIKKNLEAINKHWQKFWFHYFCLAVIVACFLIYYIFRAIFPSPIEIIWGNMGNTEGISIQEEMSEPPFRHPLTGAVSNVEIARPQVFGVMVENSAEAWPLSGLEDAFLVIEAPVEAKIPRVIAFYSTEQDTEKIGPVRSARPYYLDWAQELRALYTHVGGSPEALELIEKNDVFDLNQFWNGDYFWRSSTRSAPHNVYTSVELLNKALTKIDTPAPDYGTWSFKNDDPAEPSEDSETDVSLNSTEPLYQVTWKYNAEKNYYERWKTSGTVVKSYDGVEIVANNVAVVYTSIKVIDNVGRRKIETIGQGNAKVLQDGRIISAVWKKESANDRLRFYAEDGKEIKWNAGKTWIEIVSTTEWAQD